MYYKRILIFLLALFMVTPVFAIRKVRRRFDAERFYRNYFEAPFSRISGLVGKDVSKQTIDDWIAFKSKTEPRLRHYKEYKPVECKELVHWFAEHMAIHFDKKQHPEEKNYLDSLSDKENLRCLSRQKDKRVSYEHGTWVMYNLETRLYYVRNWKNR